MKEAAKKRSDIAFYIKIFQPPMDSDIYDIAQTIVCENSLELLEHALAEKPILKKKCDTDVLEKNFKLAEELGIMRVPSIILPDGKILPDVVDSDTLLKLIVD